MAQTDAASATSRLDGSLWSATIGGGAGVRPTYEGSNHYFAAPAVYAEITYDDWLSFGPDGLTASWHAGNFRIGGGLTGDEGRADSDQTFRQGDDRLRGLGNIDVAAGLKAFASYKLGPVSFNGSVSKFKGFTDHDDRPTNDGVLVSLGAAAPFQMTDKLAVVAKLGATWADQSYTQTFFGVTAAQAARSRFAPFTASAGLKSIDASVSASYQFDQHWSILALLGAEQLQGDAARSPTTFSRTAAAFGAVVNYHF